MQAPLDQGEARLSEVLTGSFGYVQMRKPRKNRSVIGWELRRQLREPAGGCDDSMAELYVCVSGVSRLGRRSPVR